MKDPILPYEPIHTFKIVNEVILSVLPQLGVPSAATGITSVFTFYKCNLSLMSHREDNSLMECWNKNAINK